MQKIVILLFSIIPILAYADPFYADNEKEHNQEQIANTEINQGVKKHWEIPACLKNKNTEIVSLSIPFNELKFVGVFKQQDIFIALFIDKEKRITGLKENQLIIDDAIQIEKINLQKIDYLDWTKSNHCIQQNKITISI
ncbi:hypothetical protein ACWIUA_03780 [Ursidibacter sp. B-7004-1]